MRRIGGGGGVQTNIPAIQTYTEKIFIVTTPVRCWLARNKAPRGCARVRQRLVHPTMLLCCIEGRLQCKQTERTAPERWPTGNVNVTTASCMSCVLATGCRSGGKMSLHRKRNSTEAKIRREKTTHAREPLLDVLPVINH